MLEHPTIRARLGVFVGERPAADFSVEVQKIEEKPGTLRVLVFETSPAPGSPAPQVLTQPYHINQGGATGASGATRASLSPAMPPRPAPMSREPNPRRRKGRRRLAGFLTTLLGIALLAFPGAALARPDNGNTEGLLIRLDQGLLTVKATEVPHRLILEGLAKHLGFELIVTGPLEDRRSLELEGKPWEEVLRRALFPTSWALVYDPSPGRLAKVFVFAHLPAPARPGAPPPSAQAREATRKGTPPTPRQQGGAGALLAHLLNADDEDVRAIAIFGLAATGGEEAIEALTKALQDEEASIREMAVEALGEIGGERAIQGLRQALGDRNEEVRRAAHEALGRLLRRSP
ncbi:MAG: HEAT repeat domain-containing protein [Candidatus Rokubacteria bacterium]|nr:HEAT repeat domain-containing protein [Candidatus Rokubacteria bacterium]